MVKQELIERSPVRFLEKSANGGLAAGEIGVLTSKKRVGKNFCVGTDWFGYVVTGKSCCTRFF